MEYDSQGHVVVKSKEYPKAMHDGKGTLVQARDAAHETELRSRGFSHKVWDRDVHGKAKASA